MKEREYMNAKELGMVTSVINVFRDIVPENSESITKEEYQEIGSLLYKWQDKLFKNTKIK